VPAPTGPILPAAPRLLIQARAPRRLIRLTAPRRLIRGARGARTRPIRGRSLRPLIPLAPTRCIRARPPGDSALAVPPTRAPGPAYLTIRTLAAQAEALPITITRRNTALPMTKRSRRDRLPNPSPMAGLWVIADQGAGTPTPTPRSTDPAPAFAPDPQSQRGPETPGLRTVTGVMCLGIYLRWGEGGVSKWLRRSQ
jgi:hypothetical protein